VFTLFVVPTAYWLLSMLRSTGAPALAVESALAAHPAE
jgi:hypothetical protein